MRTRANTCAAEAFGIVVVDDDNDNDADHHQHRVAAHIKCVSRLIRVRALDGPVRMRHFSRPDLAVRRTCRRRRARWTLLGPVTTPLLRTPFPLIMLPQHARTHARPQSWAKGQKINIGQGTLSLFFPRFASEIVPYRPSILPPQSYGLATRNGEKGEIHIFYSCCTRT